MTTPRETGRRAGALPLPDTLLALGVAAVLSAVVALSSAAAAMPSSPVAYAFACGFGAVLLLRRIAPVSVLVVSALGTFAYYILDLPPIGVALPVVAALFSAAERGLVRWAVATGVAVLVVSVFFRLRDADASLAEHLSYDAVSNLALVAAGAALGYSVRARRIQAAQHAEIVRLTESQLARDGEHRMRAERERISRELHDTVGHTMSVISLHAAAGAEAVGLDDRAASDAFDRIRAASTRSLHEVRGIVRILRSASGRSEMSGVRSLSAVPDLLEAAGAAGISATAAIGVDPSSLPAPVDAAAYRVIQESLTNVIRHAGAARAMVSVELRDGLLRVSVSDDGHGTVDEGADGYGIAGMDERVRLLGGTLTAGAAEGSGFRVEASIPARLP